MVGGATPWTFTYALAHGYVSAYVRAYGACPGNRSVSSRLWGLAPALVSSIRLSNQLHRPYPGVAKRGYGQRAIIARGY
jgi:hypothetical protein